MDTIQVKTFQEKLLKRRKQIVETLRHLAEENQQVTGQRHFDWLDQARDENEKRLLDRLNDGYLVELEKIRMALERISAGTYGLCMACHQPMEKVRLEIFPEAEFCLECQEIREKFEKAA